MTNSVICPRCGTENRADAMNCEICRINLMFAQEHPAEIGRLKQEDARRELLEGSIWTKDHAGNPAAIEKPVLLPMLLLLGSFVFVFCLGEAVHELGHFLIHRAYGVNVGIRLDPFGGSEILHGASAPQEIWGITSLGGPLLNLLVSMTVFLIFWWIRRPMLLPLLLWGPISLVQEGVTFSLGMLTPGGDADLIVRWGVPATLLISLGVLFLVSGIAMICCLLPLVNLTPANSYSRKFKIVIGGMVSFMVLRLLFSGLRSPNLLIENTVPLEISILLATIVVFSYSPMYPILSRISGTELKSVSWPEVVFSTTLGTGMVLFQLLSFN